MRGLGGVVPGPVGMGMWSGAFAKRTRLDSVGGVHVLPVDALAQLVLLPACVCGSGRFTIEPPFCSLLAV